MTSPLSCCSAKTATNVADGWKRHAVVLRKPNAFFGGLPNLEHLGVGDLLRAGMGHAIGALIGCVSDVLALRPQRQMRGIDAAGVVAGVHDHRALRDVTLGEHVGYAVRVLGVLAAIGKTAKVEHAVTVMERPGRPRPATGGFLVFRVEPC